MNKIGEYLRDVFQVNYKGSIRILFLAVLWLTAVIVDRIEL